MEFMYCIPDLEVFIDKTIKKCLLEYDLDANDTEAVLDDMEKAWPKTTQSEKEVLKDCNDNTQSGRVGDDVVATNRCKDSTKMATLDKCASKCADVVVSSITSETVEKMNSNQNQASFETTTGRSRPVSASGDCNRSNTSSPDFVETQKHAKLKSILQQRYFQGSKKHETDNDLSRNPTSNKLDDATESLKPLPSNLDILATAANIHNGTHRGSKEQNNVAWRHEQDVLGAKTMSDRRPRNSSDGSESTTTLPVLTSLISTPSGTNSYTAQHSIRGTSDPRCSISSRCDDKRPCQKVPEIPSFQGGASVTTAANVQTWTNLPAAEAEKAHRLFEHYQNGYHSLIPRETVVVRKQLPMSVDEADFNLRTSQRSSLAKSTSSSANAHTDQLMKQHPVVSHHRHEPHNNGVQDYFHPGTFPVFHQHYESRIANIIVEELQKDSEDNCSSNSPVKNIPSSEMTIPFETSYSTFNELNILKPPLPEPLKRTGEIYSVMVGPKSQILPAHLVKPDYKFTSGSLLLRPDEIPYSSHKATTSKTVPSDGLTYDDKPQDLSMKSTRKLETKIETDRHSWSNSHSSSPTTDVEKPGYFSTPNSPAFAPVPCGHSETLAARPASSPSNSSDKDCDYSPSGYVRNTPHKTAGQWEKKGQVHGIDLCSRGNRKVHAEKRRAEAVKTWIGDGSSSTNKKGRRK